MDDLRDYFMDEIWPLLTADQKKEMLELAAFLARYAPKDTRDTDTRDNRDSDD